MIDVLRQMFSMFVVLEQIVSDNGAQFTSEVFAIVLSVNGIKHSKSAPYHPSTNGLAVRFVQSLKQGLSIIWFIPATPTEQFPYDI